MPEKKVTLQAPGYDSNTIKAIAFSAFKQLNWPVQLTINNIIVVHTETSYTRSSQQVTLEARDGMYNLKSEMIKGEAFDFGGRNKKNLDAFAAAFEKLAATITEEEKHSNLVLAEDQELAIIELIKKEQAEAEAVAKAFRLSGSNLYVTYAIMAINILVFVLMIIGGAGLVEPESNGYVHIQWGSNYTPLTLSGDWWRLITSQFLHFGIIHIAMNMYALYMVAVYLEPMLGKIRYTIAYLCAGVFGGLVSLWWHKEGVNGAGASGAIFGLYGLMLAMLTTSLIPASARKALLQSMVIFIAFNLFYGMKGGIDNAAHIGGLLSGFVFGMLYAFVIKKENEHTEASATVQHKPWPALVLVLITAAASFFYLDAHKISDVERKAGEKIAKESSYNDVSKYYEDMNAINEMEIKALAPLQDSLLQGEALKEKLTAVSLPGWNGIIEKLSTMTGYSLSPATQEKIKLLKQYAEMRKEQTLLIINKLDHPEEPGHDEKINIVSEQLLGLMEKIQRLQ